MSSTINRLALVAGSVLAGGILGVLAMSTAAHADDKPAAAVAEHRGGALGAVEAVVDQVTPDEPKPEPTKEPAPPAEPEPDHSEEPAAEPEPTEPAEQAPAEVPVEVPPVVITTPPAPPVVVTPPPVVIVTPPVVTPTPTPTPTPAPEQPTVQLPVDLDDQADVVEAIVPAEPVAAPLPVLIGPLPGRTLDDGIRPAEPAALPEVPICDDPDRDPAQPRGDEKQHRRVHTTPTAAADKPRPARPCPDTPGNPGQAINTLSVKPPPPDGQQLVADSAAGAYSRPVLHRLTQMRPRSDLPAGRTEHPEPGPA